MRPYLVTLMLIALLVGSLFRAADQTGMRVWVMFGTMGIFLIGVVGSLALSRMHAKAGRASVETALKGLEPDWVITDWAGEGGGRPHYLLVGPRGLVAVYVDETPQSSFGWRARQTVAAGRGRCLQAAAWVAERLQERVDGDAPPVQPVLLLARRRAEAGYSADGVMALNPDDLAAHLHPGEGEPLLGRSDRFRLTRLLREEGLATGADGRIRESQGGHTA